MKGTYENIYLKDHKKEEIQQHKIEIKLSSILKSFAKTFRLTNTIPFPIRKFWIYKLFIFLFILMLARQIYSYSYLGEK